MVRVVLDSWMAEFGTPKEVALEAPSIGALLDALEQKYPRLRFRLRDETGSPRRFIRFFVDGEVVEPTHVMGTPIRDDQTVDILHSIAGG